MILTPQTSGYVMGRRARVMKRSVCLTALTLIMIGFLLSPLGVHSVKAFVGDITINNDGSVDPPYAPVSHNGNVYSLTNDVQGSIFIGKDYVTLDGAGRKLQGPGNNGILLSQRTNVTIMRLTIQNFSCGIYLASSNQNIVSQTNIANNNEGLYLSFSSNNRLRGNLISTNNLTGLFLDSSSNNNILENKITGNSVGIYIQNSANNVIFHNNLISNAQQIQTESSTGVWDNGYPLGGNYWSDYTGTDSNADGIGDSSYIIDSTNVDNYPLMHIWKLGDATYDGKVNVLDLIAVAVALGTNPGDLKWNPRADVTQDGRINVLDLITVATSLGT
jgi:parallel beta-helix repeat protein